MFKIIKSPSCPETVYSLIDNALSEMEQNTKLFLSTIINQTKILNKLCYSTCFRSSALMEGINQAKRISEIKFKNYLNNKIANNNLEIEIISLGYIKSNIEFTCYVCFNEITLILDIICEYLI